MNRPEPERAKVGSPGSRPERGSAAATVAPEPNGVCAPPPPPSGEAAGGLLAPAPSGPKRPEVVEHTHALLAWAVPAVGKFPRTYRFTPEAQLEHATRLSDAVGRQVGGWLKRLA